MKFKKKLIPFCFLLITASTNAVNLNSNGTHGDFIVPYYMELVSYNSWKKSFFEFLIDNESVEMQAVGVALYYQVYDHTDFLAITYYLNKLLPQKLSKESLYILKNVCNKVNKYKATCENHEYHNKLIQSDVHNLNLYIDDLYQAKAGSNSKLAKELIQKVNESTHASSYDGFFMKDLKRELRNYFKINPNPLSEPHHLFDDNEIKLSLKQKNETIINNLAYLFSQKFPSYSYYGYFLDSCNKNSTEEKLKLCNKVIDTIINQSDSENNKAVGYYRRTDLELINYGYRISDYQMPNNTLIAHAKMILTKTCEANPSKIGYYKMYMNYRNVHPLYLDTVIENTKRFGIDKAKTLGYKALKKYLIAKKLFDVGSFKDCKIINTLTGNKIYEKYKNNSLVAHILKKYKEIE